MLFGPDNGIHASLCTKHEGESMWESNVLDPYAVPDGISLDVDYLDDEAGLFVPIKNIFFNSNL